MNAATTTLLDQIRGTGGATYAPDRPAPASGFMVSLNGSERTIPLAEFGPTELVNYMQEYAYRIDSDPRLYYGAWVDGGTVYLDISMNIADRAEALLMGEFESQKAIYDVTTGDVINL
ncbi:hypothetical protein GCM10010218_20080 [Streptomyces mashuensis]|uniref:Uncharacterized protein n=1 Tax=Streptomyces mashuensis TaxID=33904 RepID=A0A919B2K9_9ACTN|nr:hypothetical protein [Streptomyces mashuensis]GHF38823.1 hypothetical protein GCM10010218_20080 [Streptomyces mashuensis]